ncbi:hypothetical protein [Natronobeatus ordinarius]|uniref:hypothetical protein n=1 Tax=Natronobeatus ordinarius TaxID=2963433 RepID=UPI0020CB8FD4|nr:hypothetical protein [Natronobeatus ordinarius]
MPTENQFERTGDGEKRDGRGSPNTGSVDRRQLLGIVATTGATALAGCTFELDDDGFEVGFGSDDDPEGDATEEVRGEGNGAADPEGPEGEDDDLDDEGETAEGKMDDPDDEGDDPDDETDESGEEEDDPDGETDENEDEEDDPDDETDENGDEEDDPEPPFSEDCIGIDPTDLAIEEISGGRWRVNSGRSGLLVFDEKDDAETAKAILEHYEFTSFCFVARPDPPMTYWLTDGDAPSASSAPAGGEDCIGVDPTDLAIEEISGGRWRVNSGRRALLIFDEKDDAETAKAIIEHYEFTSFCFVARPDPPMTYWTR